MMLRKLGPALLVIVGLFSGSAASASPLTFYTDEAAWLAAVSGFTVGTYPVDVTYTDTLVNLAIFPSNAPEFAGTCCIVTTPPPIFPSAPPVIGPNFTQVYITFSSLNLDEYTFPLFYTLATDVVVNFPTPIYGFASSSAFRQEEFAAITFNGQAPFPGIPDFGGFFGVVGLINSLDISCMACDPEVDENTDLELYNIVVATVDEPSGFVSLATGLVLLALALSRFRRHAGCGHRWHHSDASSKRTAPACRACQ
jgi:hypothetical protein